MRGTTSCKVYYKTVRFLRITSTRYLRSIECSSSRRAEVERHEYGAIFNYVMTMGNKISTIEPRTISYISVVKDPAGEAGFGIDLVSEEPTENDHTEKSANNKSRLAVRHSEDTVAQGGVVSPGNTSYTMDINQLPFPTIICDTDFQISVVNSSMNEFTGLPATAIPVKLFWSLFRKII